MQSGSNTVVLTADGKINAQRVYDRDSTQDQVKAFTPVDQPLRNQYAAKDASGQNMDSIRPVRTAMPSVGSGPLPTPHAVPHQSPPAYTAQSNATISNMQDATQQHEGPATTEDDAVSTVNAPLMGSTSPHVPRGAPPRGQRPRPNRAAPQ